jgi:hypothetical protein
MIGKPWITNTQGRTPEQRKSGAATLLLLAFHIKIIRKSSMRRGFVSILWRFRIP